MNEELGGKPLKRTGRLKVDGVEVSGVRCEIQRPSRVLGEIRAAFEWNSSGKPALYPGVGEFEFDTAIDIGSGWVRERLRLLDMHVNFVSKRFAGKEALDISAMARVGTLEMIHVLSEYQAGPLKTHLTFFLTPNRMLLPWKIIETSNTGKVKHHRARGERLFSMAVPGVGRIKIDDHYEWSSDERGDASQSKRYLVAKVVSGIQATDTDGILQHVVGPLEDALLLAGFASRTPTRCAGWLAFDGVASIDHYRRQVSLPSGKQRHRTKTNGGLVELSDLQRFLSTTVRAFSKSSLKSEIRQAIYALNNAPDDTIEHRIISLFNAFEGLVVAMTPTRRTGSTKSNRTHEAVRNELLAQLGNWVAEKRISDDFRRALSRQIRGKPPLSFSDRYRLLLRRVALSHEDLWPIIARGETRSLYQIRNLLSHGGSFGERHFDALVTAGHHLEWLLERLLCALFKWPLDDTDINPAELPMYWRKDSLDWESAEMQLRA